MRKDFKALATVPKGNAILLATKGILLAFGYVNYMYTTLKKALTCMRGTVYCNQCRYNVHGNSKSECS